MNEHICPWWFAFTFDNPLRKIFHNPQKILSPYVKEGYTVTDIGCGIGFFSIGMAKLVGKSGKVISIDLQEKMLVTLKKRAERAGVSDIITTATCSRNDIHLNEKVDFALSFWMMHEVPDKAQLFKQIYNSLKDEGKLLFVEPKIHVSLQNFEKLIKIAESSGFKLAGSPEIRLSRTALFEKT